MKVTVDNLNKVADLILSQISDENGRGEFDSESDLLSAIEKVIGWIEGEKNEKNNKN